MTSAQPESIDQFLQQQDAATLRTVLLELASRHEHVMDRLLRLQMAQQPNALSAEFKKTLKAWQRSSKYHGYDEAPAYGRKLETWLSEVAAEVQPNHPAAAVALFEQFIELDRHWFEHADDSGGNIGMAMQSACRHWLRAAAQSGLDPNHVATHLVELWQGDQYGGREELLRQANILLGESGLRALVTKFEHLMVQAAPHLKIGSPRSTEVFKISGALSLLSEALRDPEVKIRAVLAYSPDPNPLQQQSFAQAYLDAGNPQGALQWLQGHWPNMEDTRQTMLASALESLGRLEESIPLHQHLFEANPDVFELQNWLKHVADSDQPSARTLARQVARNAKQVAAGAAVLLALDDVDAAQALVIERAQGLDGQDYDRMLSIARSFSLKGRAVPESLIYRALLVAILERGYTKAYGHGARYLMRLRELALKTAVVQGLVPSHAEFEAAIRQQHGRKASFWNKV